MPEAAVPYLRPENWIRYDFPAVAQFLVDAKAAILSLTTIPYQRDWVQKLQELQLKMEAAGTSRIEGAELTESELDAAMTQSPEKLLTRSQRQASAAAATYRWIAAIPHDRPVTEELVKEVHQRMVTGCDDDHCPPGQLRGPGQNVIFGFPRHRGAEGGPVCQTVFSRLVGALNHEYRGHDPLVQAIAFHYHFAGMHPFLDGNGRTARALEALLLQRLGLRDTAFIAMSNYYYQEKPGYLAALAAVRARQHDLTPFLVFSLRGVTTQCLRVLGEIRKNVKKAVFQNMMYDLFGRLQSPKKRVIAQRQIEILRMLLEVGRLELAELERRMLPRYSELQGGRRAFTRDVTALLFLGCVNSSEREPKTIVEINLDWPEQVTETDFMDRIKNLPKAKSSPFL